MEQTGTILRFADITLDGTRACLRGADGAEIAIAPKPFDLLMVLARNAGRTMSKDSLLDAVWPGVNVTEDSLFQAVREARRAIGDAEGHVLRSVPRRGYMLDSPVSPGSAQRVAQARPVAPVPTVLTPPTDRPSLVVLPFQNMSADAEQDYFADGVVEEVTTALACIRPLFVIARSSAFVYKGQAIDVRQVGRALGVRYVLEGSVRRAGGQVRIGCQLIEAENGHTVWAERFDGDAADLFALQDRVMEAVAGAIEPKLQRAEIERAQRKPTQDLTAYDHFLRGMAALQDGVDSRLHEAKALFTEAFTRDPGYGAAYGMAALCVFRMNNAALLLDDAPEAAEAVRLAKLAVETGRDDPTALWSASCVLSSSFARDPAAGALLAERACTLNPNAAMAWNYAGHAQNLLGNTEAAIAHFARAMRLSPQDPFRHLFLGNTVMAHLQAGRYEDALGWAARCVNERPSFVQGHRLWILTLVHVDRLEEARLAAQALLRDVPHTMISRMRAAWRPEFQARLHNAYRLAGIPE